jgi:hypothetical protein
MKPYRSSPCRLPAFFIPSLQKKKSSSEVWIGGCTCTEPHLWLVPRRRPAGGAATATGSQPPPLDRASVARNTNITPAAKRNRDGDRRERRRNRRRTRDGPTKATGVAGREGSAESREAPGDLTEERLGRHRSGCSRGPEARPDPPTATARPAPSDLVSAFLLVKYCTLALPVQSSPGPGRVVIKLLIWDSGEIALSAA